MPARNLPTRRLGTDKTDFQAGHRNFGKTSLPRFIFKMVIFSLNIVVNYDILYIETKYNTIFYDVKWCCAFDLDTELTDATHARARRHYKLVTRNGDVIAVNLMSKYGTKLLKVDGNG